MLPMLRLACRGWDRADWADTYYPADLPPDWRLRYLANDADGVLLTPALYATAAADADCPPEDWADEVPADFRFFLAADSQRLAATDPAPVPVELAALLGSHWGGTLYADPSAAPRTDARDLYAYMLATPVDGVSQLWTDRAAARALARVELAAPSPRAVRILLEALTSRLSDCRELWLLIDGPDNSPRQLQDFRVVGDLLGFA